MCVWIQRCPVFWGFFLYCHCLHHILFYDCLALQVCVVGGVVHPVGSEWEEGCEKCSCSQLQDKATSLHVAQCTPPVCDRTCPQVRHTHTDNQQHMQTFFYVSVTIFMACFRAPRTLSRKESAVGSVHRPAVWSQRERCEGTHWLG